MEPYPVYFEKEGEYVAEFKFTVLLMPNGTMKISGIPLDVDSYQTENSITDEAIKVDFLFFLGMSLISNFFGVFVELVSSFIDNKKEKEEEEW